MRNSDTLYFINIKNFKLQNTEKEGKRKKKRKDNTLAENIFKSYLLIKACIQNVELIEFIKTNIPNNNCANI